MSGPKLRPDRFCHLHAIARSHRHGAGGRMAGMSTGDPLNEAREGTLPSPEIR